MYRKSAYCYRRYFKVREILDFNGAGTGCLPLNAQGSLFEQRIVRQIIRVSVGPKRIESTVWPLPHVAKKNYHFGDFICNAEKPYRKCEDFLRQQ